MMIVLFVMQLTCKMYKIAVRSTAIVRLDPILVCCYGVAQDYDDISPIMWFLGRWLTLGRVHCYLYDYYINELEWELDVL